MKVLRNGQYVLGMSGRNYFYDRPDRRMITMYVDL